MMMNRYGFFEKVPQEHLEDLPYQSFSGKIHLIDSPEKAEKAFIALSKYDLLGFDTETRPTFKKGRINKTALIQLATSNEAFLFRLNCIGFPDGLIKILEDESVIKVGVAIKDDIKCLGKLKRYRPAGFVELQDFVKQFEIIDNGLKKLTANILGFKISKRQQTSNWEAQVLSRPQQEYAATDAWVCWEIYHHLSSL